MIGIVGGIGSYAGIDLIRKIYDLSGATCDQDHLPVNMISIPHRIGDRTEYLLGQLETNPGLAIADIISMLAAQGAEVIGIPCNTAHAPPIFDVISNRTPSNVQLLHMIEEVAAHLVAEHPLVKQVGLLGTTGLLQSRVYPTILQQVGLEVIEPTTTIQENDVHAAIYDRSYGIKAFSCPVRKRAREKLTTAAQHLSRKGAQAIILGCTEVSLAFTENRFERLPVVDASTVLAAALVRESCREQEN